MFSLREFWNLLFAVLILGFVSSWAFLGTNLLDGFITASLLFLIIVFVSVISKKIISWNLFDAYEESKIWSFQKYWFGTGDSLPSAIPMGFILPFFLSVLSLGKLPWFGVLESDVRPSKFRGLRRKGLYRYVEITEGNFAVIAFTSIISVLLLGIVAYFINLPVLASLSVWYAFFNVLPVGRLDGSKLFFGNRSLWYLTFVLTAFVLVGSIIII